MAVFSFQAKSFSGKAVSGNIEAENESEARVKIRSQKLIPIKVIAGNGLPGKQPRSTSASKGTPKQLVPRGRAKSKDIQVLTRQLSVLISSGVPLVQALEVLSQSSRGKVIDVALQRIVKDISEGKKLGVAFGVHSNVFSKFYISMLIAGEEGGVLDTVLSRLAEYIEKAVKLQRKVRGAMMYPGFILGFSILVISLLLVFLVPKIAEMFKGSGQELPALTVFIMNLSDGFRDNWYFIFGGMFLIYFFTMQYYRSQSGRQVIDRAMIRVPVFGDFIVKSGMARFSRTLSTLLSAGVSIMDALDIAASTAGNSLIESALNKAKASVSEGKLLSMPLAKESFMPSMVTQMIAVGEQTGSLDEMLNKVADFYDDEVDVAVASLTSLIEPILIVFVGGMVAFIIIAMYLPIFKLASG